MQFIIMKYLAEIVYLAHLDFMDFALQICTES